MLDRRRPAGGSAAWRQAYDHARGPRRTGRGGADHHCTGKGSSVLFDGRPPDDRLGWAGAPARKGVESRLRTLAVHETHDSGLATQLRLEKNTFACVERTRELVADATTVLYERSYLPPVSVIRELPAQGLGQDSLAEVLLRAGLRPDHGEQRVSGRRIDAHEAELLLRQPGNWFLDARRTSRAADGSFAEHVAGLLDPDHFQLTIAFG
ncbi:UTRA domain-containing protein [Streptomyces sp. NPDC001816]|uniref:UTRA domain-containing protein n=1 Tax=Streptomyces sp. NPDC001816 TaxID=3364612 RepID=UPI0036911161